MFANALALTAFTHLQASGRPDRVTMVLLFEIPPYLLLLYLGSKFYGLPGAAAATAFRYTLDFVLLTSISGWPSRARLHVLGHFLLLGTAVLIAGRLDFGDWRWWAAGFALVSAALFLGWRTAPQEMKEIAVRRAGIILRRN